MKIEKIVVLLTDSTDSVTIYTDFSSPFPNWLPDYEMKMGFECAHNYGATYVLDNFGVTPEVINTRVRK